MINFFIKLLLKISFVLVLLAITVIGVTWIVVNKSTTFAEEIQKCNNVGKEYRFSCYRANIQKYYGGKSLEEFSKRLKNTSDLKFQDDVNNSRGENVSYAIFGTNCHTFYHAAGDFVAVTAPKSMSLKDKLNLGENSCTSGYMMGVFKRTALMYGYKTSVLKEFQKACGIYGTHQCSHEIGHILHDKYTYSILKILDSISEKDYGLKYSQKFDYTATDKTDLNAPFEECKKLVPSTELNYCETGIGHNMFLFAEFAPQGYKEVFNECDNNVKAENRESCFAYIIYRIGQNEAGPKMLSGKTAEAKEACEEAIKISGYKEIRKHCFIGIGGGIGLYADSEFSGFVSNEYNIKAARERLVEFIGYCKKLDEDDIDTCIAGIFGTPFKKLYQKFLIQDDRANEVLKKIDKDFQVVG